MKRKVTILVFAVISVAALALPIMATAGTWHAEKAVGGGSPGHFAGAGSISEWKISNGLVTSCSSTTVTGAFETTTAGWIELTFHGCKGLPCTSPGQPSGTIVTTKLTFYLVKTDAASTTPFLLITPNHVTGTVAHPNCFGLLRAIEGNGIVATLAKPTCGVSSNSAELKFESASAGHQKHQHITGVNYNLVYSGNSLSIDMLAAVNFAQSTKVNCT